MKRQSSRLRIPPHSGEEFAVDVCGAFDDVEDIRAQETRGDPDVVETSGYAAAFERAIRLLDPLLEIENRLEETRAITLAGLLIQARLLETASSLSSRGGGRLLATMIAGLEEMTEPAR